MEGEDVGVLMERVSGVDGSWGGFLGGGVTIR